MNHNNGGNEIFSIMMRVSGVAGLCLGEKKKGCRRCGQVYGR